MMKRNKAWSKEYRKEYEKQYHFKNKKRINKLARDRRARNVKKHREYDNQWWAKNKEKYQWHNLSPERQERKREIWKKSHIKNKVKRNKYSREWHAKNREYSRQLSKEYRTNPANKERLKKLWRRGMRKRLANPNTKLKHYLRTRLNAALKGKHKSKRTMELLDCTIDELWVHLESKFEPWMTRENYGLWHVDHIKACSKFDLTDAAQQRECFHWSNLQPLEAVVNIKKGAR